jgi:DNA-binding PucR family transcriptional regulator
MAIILPLLFTMTYFVGFSYEPYFLKLRWLTKMTLEELRVAIAASPNAEELQKIQISCPNRNIELTGLSAIYQFLIAQIAGFETLEKHGFFDISKKELTDIKGNIESGFNHPTYSLQLLKV